jgi:formate hydrogenlyase transcriptional activator
MMARSDDFAYMCFMRAMSEPNASLVGIVDDDSGQRESISSLVRSVGLRSAVFSSAEEFLGSEELKYAACLILDVRMPRISGLDLQSRLAEMACRIPIIFATGYSDAEAQRKALDDGAVAFLHKPFSDEALFDALRLAQSYASAYNEISRSRDRLALENVYLESEIRSELHFGDIVGKSEALRRVLSEIETVAPVDATVLIYGETGTGKELIARAVHNLSSRKSNAFVKLNCAAIPTGLLESELFGHEKGAFTGAISQRVGRFELAHRGTIFLDEIGEIPLELQPKLLRVLQEREFERLGSTRTLRTDARLIAATNRDLEVMVDEQTFRSDLYYRLNVFPVRLPSLRERREDIPLLVRHFVQQFSQRNNREINSIPSETMEALVRYHWPGNIRELQNVIERAVIISEGPVLHVSLAELDRDVSAKTRCRSPVRSGMQVFRTLWMRRSALTFCTPSKRRNGVVGGPNGAAARLGIKRTTLHVRMQKLGIHLSRTAISGRR